MHDVGGCVKKDFAPLGSLSNISGYGTTKEFHPRSCLRESDAGFLAKGFCRHQSS
jgi:hypothetical protein